MQGENQFVLDCETPPAVAAGDKVEDRAAAFDNGLKITFSLAAPKYAAARPKPY